jgi:hypothetical protein
MPSGQQCHAYALRGQELCYFHCRRRTPAGKPADWIEIPLLEDRCAVQATITQVLRAVVNKTIDRPRASLLLYGLQLSLQSVDRAICAIPYGTVRATSEPSDGEELAVDPDDFADEDEDKEEEGSDDSSDDSGGEEDNPEEDDSEDDDEDDDPDNETTEELVAGAQYLESVSNALHVGDTRQVERLLKE